jgi:ABC-type lipoprotein export system ATPase subunit
MSENQDLLVETRDLTRIYGSGEQSICALNKVNLRLHRGDLVAVMGPSGSGKSTLLNLLGALDAPTSGQVIINDRDMALVKNLDTFRAKTVGFVFQLHNLIPTLTAQENVEIPMMGHLDGKQRRQRSAELLEMVGLQDRMKHLPAQLSGGQRQRVAVARALANQPQLILADEPTGNLDSQAGRDLLALMQKLNRSQGCTFVIVTHDPAVARLTDRVIEMADGRIIREDRVGTPIEEDLKVWRYSDLGQRILNGYTAELGIEPQQLEVLERLLREDEHRGRSASSSTKTEAHD